MKLTKAERAKLKQSKRDIEDKKLVGNILVTKLPRKKKATKSKSKSGFSIITINTVKARKQRRKKIKMPTKSIRILPRTKPENSALYKFLVR